MTAPLAAAGWQQSFIGLAVPPGPAKARGNPAALVLPDDDASSSAAAAEAGANASSGSSSVEGLVQPQSPHFSGLVFKLQANMDPKHRDKARAACRCCLCATFCMWLCARACTRLFLFHSNSEGRVSSRRERQA